MVGVVFLKFKIYASEGLVLRVPFTTNPPVRLHGHWMYASDIRVV